MRSKIPLTVLLLMLVIMIFSSGCGGTTTISTTTTPGKTNPPPSSTTKTRPTSTAAQPPAQVSGTVYYRDPSVSFPLDADPAPYALEGAAVSVSGYNVVTGADGKYIIPAGAGYQTITISKDGYIPTQVSWDFASGQSYTFNIGMYRAPAAINPRSGFINGVITWDAGGWLIDYYYKKGFFPSTYANIAANAGAGLVTVSDPLFITSATADHVTMSPNSLSGSYWRMMNESEYSALVADAHSKGLRFMLWIGTMDEGKTDYYRIVYADAKVKDTFWNDWFSEYERYAVPLAQMAEKLGIEYISLGHDMAYAIDGYRFSGGPADSLARWQKLTTAIRAVYRGKLAYFGGLSIMDNYYEDNGYPPGFVDLFDVIGVNVQAVSPAFNPSLDELKASITALLDRYTEWQRPIFIMVRTPSVDGGTSFETYIEPLLAVNREADHHAMNVWQQADIYEAFYEVLNERPAGNGQVMGLFSWGYNYLDNYLTVPGQRDGAMAMDKSANIRGKPAEAVMKFWNFLK